MIRAGLYVRVSTDRLTVENQLAELRQLATVRGFEPVVWPLLVAIFGWVAEQERTRLIERTKAGLERARREGKRLGRPPASPVLLHAARDLVLQGVPVAEAARQKGVARSTLQRFIRESGAASRSGS